jgi:hypothetical protein
MRGAQRADRGLGGGGGRTAGRGVVEGHHAVTRPLARGLNWLEKQAERAMRPINEAEQVAADYYGEQAQAWSKKKLKPAEHGALEGGRKGPQGDGRT